MQLAKKLNEINNAFEGRLCFGDFLLQVFDQS
jgi:hypothetical protein